ncbi:hypothetical protein GCM10009430_15200 [Aquimarina litoralis]|uniref:Outer membrane protein beta-barrel domain-containing protein n=1 Tax=Aquimarina litoralis TaxID=584605 RepID=A0ABN1INJ9_9FLAO
MYTAALMKSTLFGFFVIKKYYTNLQFFLIIFLLTSYMTNAQVTLRIEPGILLDTDSNNLGLLLNAEPNVKASEKSTIGLRFGISINPHKIRLDCSLPYFIDELDDNGVISFVPTYDYNINNKYYSPYIGVGLGYYLFNNVDVSNRNSSTSDVLEGSVKNQLGFLLRGGLDIGNVRCGLEYNFMPNADIKIQSEQKIGIINNSYLGLFIGIKIGGRKIKTNYSGNI